jgi:hypothetical protein
MKTKMIALTLALTAFYGVAYHAAFGAEAQPAANKVPVAVCNDGKTMYSSNPSEHRGACSGHGGVASWADGSEVKSHAKKTSYR